MPTKKEVILVKNKNKSYLSKSIALIQKWKNAAFGKFLLIFKWNTQKRINSKLFFTYILIIVLLFFILFYFLLILFLILH